MWRMQAGEATRLREIETENAKLKLLAEVSFEHRSAEGCLRSKALAPQARREAAARMIELLDISERRACSYTGLSRTFEESMRRRRFSEDREWPSITACASTG
jgi:hypothetical protein